MANPSNIFFALLDIKLNGHIIGMHSDCFCDMDLYMIFGRCLSLHTKYDHLKAFFGNTS
jgi:hypothetical protein